MTAWQMKKLVRWECRFVAVSGNLYDGGSPKTMQYFVFECELTGWQPHEMLTRW